MKMLLTVFLLAASVSSHASSATANHGHHGYGAGVSGGLKGAPSSAASVSTASASQGGGHYSLVDDYQPWPQAEMQQFAKPRFVPYAGE